MIYKFVKNDEGSANIFLNEFSPTKEGYGKNRTTTLLL